MCNCDKPTGTQYQWKSAVAEMPSRTATIAEDGDQVLLEFTTEASIVVRGPVTGTPYRFDHARPTEVRSADAAQMLSSGRFLVAHAP